MSCIKKSPQSGLEIIGRIFEIIRRIIVCLIVVLVLGALFDHEINVFASRNDPPMAASYYWIVYKTGTKTNPVIVSTPTTGTLESNLAAGDAVTINGVSYTLTSAGGPFPSKAVAQASPSWKSGKPPPSTAQTQGWVVIPEGEIGQVTNILATESDTLTLSGSEIVNLFKVFAAASGNPGGTYTVQELNTAQQVVAAQNSGLEVYTTQAAAQSAANALKKASKKMAAKGTINLAGTGDTVYNTTDKSYTQYSGKTYSQIATALESANPNASSAQLQAIFDTIILNRELVNSQGNPVAEPNPQYGAGAGTGGTTATLGWEQAIEQFFSAVSSVNLWIRAAKILVGGGLVILALSSMTGAGPAIVKTAVRATPLL